MVLKDEMTDIYCCPVEINGIAVLTKHINCTTAKSILEITDIMESIKCIQVLEKTRRNKRRLYI